MGRTLKQAKRRRQGGGQAEPETKRGQDNSSTDDPDRDGPNGEARSLLGDRRIEEMRRDRRTKDGEQTGDADEQERTNDTEAGEAEGIRRGTNSPDDTNMHESRGNDHQQAEEDANDYFTAREEPGTEATTTRTRREASEEPSVASPIKPRRLHTGEQGRHVKNRAALSGLQRMTDAEKREGETSTRGDTIYTATR